LAKCSAEEKALADMREKGKCHYVGRKTNTVLGIKTSDEHIFCCFSSKLSRILHEQGRKQLGIGWGSSDSPLCRGFSHKEIAALDFSSMDLSELYAEQWESVPDNVEERLESFQARLEDVQSRMEDVRCEQSL